MKYQLSRALYMRKHENGTEHDLRDLLQTTERGQRSFERHIFDWPITPFAAVLEYLDRDFLGVFERADLTVEGGQVVHRRLGTRHPHDFHAVNGILDDAAIDAGYADARSKFEHLAAKFRRHLRQSGPFLYVCKEIRIYDEVVRLMALLRRANPEHAFQILFVGYDGEDQTLTALEGEVFKAWTPMAADKEPGHEWEGHNRSWEEALAPWALTVHGGDRITRTYEESLMRPPLQKTERRGWLGRFLGGR